VFSDADQTPQVTQQARLHLPVDRPEGRLVTAGSLPHKLGEVGHRIHSHRLPSQQPQPPVGGHHNSTGSAGVT
jgi:hypothetical protein